MSVTSRPVQVTKCPHQPALTWLYCFIHSDWLIAYFLFYLVMLSCVISEWIVNSLHLVSIRMRNVFLQRQGLQVQYFGPHHKGRKEGKDERSVISRDKAASLADRTWMSQEEWRTADVSFRERCLTHRSAKPKRWRYSVILTGYLGQIGDIMMA